MRVRVSAPVILTALFGAAGTALAEPTVGDGMASVPGDRASAGWVDVDMFGADDGEAFAFGADPTSRSPVDSRRGPIWLRSLDQGLSLASNPQTPGYIQRATGVATGVDFVLGGTARAGGAIGHANTDVEFGASGGGARIDSWQANLYGSYGFGRYYANGWAGYGRHAVSTARVLDLPEAIGEASASGRYDALTWSAASEVGAVWREGRISLQPSLGIAYGGSRSAVFSEASSADSFATTLGFRAAGRWKLAGVEVAPEFKLGWRHEFGDAAPSFSANLIDDSVRQASMTIASPVTDPDSLLLSTGAKVTLGQDIAAFVNVNGRYNADDAATNATVGVRITW